MTTLYGLTPGTYCFEIIGLAPGYVDGCNDDVASYVSTPARPRALPVTYYDMATLVGGAVFPAGTVAVGRDGSLGLGVVNNNKGTLLRETSATQSSADPRCTWHQVDTTAFELIATNTFTVGVTETQSMFAAACSAGDIPSGGTCTSTWTWTMKIMSPQILSAPDCVAF